MAVRGTARTRPAQRSEVDSGKWTQWAEMPSRYPPYQTCYRRFQQWIHEGKFVVAPRLLSLDLHEQGKLDEAFVGTTFAIAKNRVFFSTATAIPLSRPAVAYFYADVLTAIEASKLASFEFYCWRKTSGTRAAQSGMDRFTLARLMGHSSPSVAARYYIHVTETHVADGFGKFVEYQTRNVAEGFAAAFPQASEAVQ